MKRMGTPRRNRRRAGILAALEGDRTLACDMGGFVDTNWLIVRFDDEWLLTEAFWYQD
jgi:hypothetical protein